MSQSYGDNKTIDEIIETNKYEELPTDFRYFKESIYYVNINSSMRNRSIELNGFDDADFNTESLFSTGGRYTNICFLYPFDAGSGVRALLDVFRIKFKIRTVQGIYISNSITNKSIDELTTFDIYCKSTDGRLGDFIKRSLNEHLHKIAYEQTYMYPEAESIFDVSVHIDELCNSDRLCITVSCNSYYEFIMTFLTNEEVGTLTGSEDVDPSDCSDRDFRRIGEDQVVDPDPASYSINLDRIYNNIKYIKLIDVNIPFSDTVINKYNDCVRFKCSTRQTSASAKEWLNLYIEHGDYTLESLAKYLESEMNILLFSVTKINEPDMFIVEGNSKTDLFEIRTKNSSHHFEFEFLSNANYGDRNLHKMLGFKSYRTPLPVHKFSNHIIINDLKRIYSKPHGKVNLKTSEYILMNINNYETLYDETTKKYYFNKINKLNQNNYNCRFLDIRTEFQNILKDLYTLNISFQDVHGLPYNFNQAEHSFTLEIIYFLDKLVGTDISSSRNAENNI